ncbi:MAG TPA: FliM/FliN family flagellar motor switch protein [Candidatus Hydrogenedentes bacterium]|jgi:flagellar motor switch protein FliN/FliY|nr:FliM/FliN family flagellar motor switch protein [Candidatus Hydrogenedentota bacterium]HPJ98118.1 FliM/FliN family flagellar motor switch protein [Candidatus Hydrogenedentota bacterium]
MEAEAKQPHEHEFREVNPGGVYGTERVSLDDLREVKMTLTAHLGYCSMTVREVLGLRRGSVVSLDRQAGEMTDIYVNGLPLARGEVVVIADVLHVRIGEIIGQEDRSGLEEAHEDAASK